MKKIVLIALVLFAKPVLASTVAADSSQVRLLSAFFGLDNALPAQAAALCAGQGPAINQDGLVVVFSHKLDAATLSASDFIVVGTNGDTAVPTCVTLAPADEADESRTVLLIGEFGNISASNPPAQVVVVGDLFTVSSANAPSLNAKDARIDSVTALAAGPYLVYARVLPPAEACCECLASGTTQVVQVAWAGGVSNPDGGEVTDTVRRAYTVVVDSAGIELTVVPSALADTGDGDNYHLLCLNTPHRPLRVSLQANLVVDPNFDLNPYTEITVTSDAPTSGVSRPQTPMRHRLTQNYPNPFNPNTVVSYELSVVSQVSLKVFDMLGHDIATLVDARQAAGSYTVRFDAKKLPSGTYFYRLKANDFVQTKRMTLVK